MSKQAVTALVADILVAVGGSQKETVETLASLCHEMALTQHGEPSEPCSWEGFVEGGDEVEQYGGEAEFEQRLVELHVPPEGFKHHVESWHKCKHPVAILHVQSAETPKDWLN